MPHDANSKPLTIGDKVILEGFVREITSEKQHYCNITIVFSKGMEPTQDVRPDLEVTNPFLLVLSARMVKKI